MSSEREPAKSVGPVVVVVLAAVAMFPVLYVLSIGPAAWMAELGYISGDEGSAAHTFYYPLIWLCEHVPLIEHALQAYVELFARGA